MDRDLKRDIILDNYENPRNKKRPEDKSYLMENSRNTSCIDNIDVYLLVEGDVIKDVKFEGEACVICISSSSIISSLLIGKSVSEAYDIISNYNNMIEEKEYNKDVLKEARVYDDIGRQPSRKGCATLFIKGVKRILDRENNNG